MTLAAGTKLGRYEIRSKIGAGGMGEVYLAQDTKLNRRVAIKFVTADSLASEQANKRLLREAEAAAKLDHPNICAVHEVAEEDGRSFIVMPYVEGETLALLMRRKSLELSESLAIAAQVADALAEAHTHGIIHRDIKPSNIIITLRGQAKVMDFGLAKLSEPPATAGGLRIDTEASTQALLTTPGAIVGTMPYMSPEQVHGQTLDARSDIFSFGVVLYEMLTGQQPFAGKSVAATISAILTKEPPPLASNATECPEELQRITSKCLEKDRERRYQTMRDVAIDLQNVRHKCDAARLTASLGGRKKARSEASAMKQPRVLSNNFTSKHTLMIVAPLALLLLVVIAYGLFLRRTHAPVPSDVKSLAVLPFKNIGGGAQDEYLSDGIADELIAKLTKLRTIRVVSLPVAMRYKNSPKDAAEIGRELGVDAVISGTVRKAGERFRVVVHLISAADGFTMWADDFDESMQNLLDAEGRLAEAVVTKLKGELTPQDRALVAKNNTANAEAYELLLRGKEQLRKGELESARQMFERATQLDPKFADAYAWLAFALGEQFDAGEGDRRVLDAAFASANKALALDPNLIVARRALITFYRNVSQTEEGLKQAKLALATNPNDQDAIKATAFAYFETGMVDRSIEFYSRALAADPPDDEVRAALARSYLYAHEYQKGLDILATALARNNWVAMLLYGKLRQYDKAAEMYEKLHVNQPNNLLGYLDYGRILKEAGQPKQAREVWLEGARVGEAQATKIENVRTRIWLGHLYAELGERDKALEQIRRVLAIEPNNAWVLHQTGEIYANLGDKRQAVSYLRQANEHGWLEFQYYEALDKLLGDDAEYRAVRDALQKNVDDLRAQY
jgi:serine/threonine protein kinase/TolB-like protein/thioredoxin-like negative regulator of GroEL